MTAKIKPCLISCNVLRNELKELVKTGKLDVDLSFYSMELHSDYQTLEKNLRKKIEEKKACSKGPVVVVTGDYCLGPENEAKKLMEECGVVKVDALNCIDCLFGGKSKFLEVDPGQERIFLSPGWIEYFCKKTKLMKGSENEETFRKMFSVLKGIVLLDTLGNLDKYETEIKELSEFTRLPILEKKKIGLENLKQVVAEAAKKKA
jgi:hypothetical protein